MKKTFFSALIAIALLFSVGIFESSFVQKQFDEFYSAVNSLYEKTDEKTITSADVLAAKNLWTVKKRYLHMFIPHSEIKEVDLWLSEAVSYSKSENYEETLSKLEVLKDLCGNIPKTFKLKPENVL